MTGGDFMFVFFFQAEDGIRDGRVTGVQTCALPIWSSSRSRTRRAKPLAPGHVKAVDAPTFIGTTRVAGHPPAKPPLLLNRWHAHHRRDEAVGVTAPSLTTGNGAAAVGGNCAVIMARPKAAPAARMS